MARHWTKAEELSLLQGVGSNGLAWICRKGGRPYPWSKSYRSKSSVYTKLYRMSGGGGVTRGSYTLAGLIRLTGYNSSQLKRAMRALKQKWKRTSPNGSFLITEDQFEEIAAWLGLDYWSKPHRLYKCLWCHARNFQHRAYGLCEQCYKKYDNRLRQLGVNRSIRGLKEFVKGKLEGADLEKVNALLIKRRALPEELLWDKNET